MLQSYDVVQVKSLWDTGLASSLLANLQFDRITSYDKVRRSYPPFKPPTDITEKSEIEKWWRDTYNERVGPLHKIPFYRIVLDGR